LERSIIVPFAYQSEASGVNDQRFIDHVWYQREVAVPAGWDLGAGRRVLVHFEAIDYFAEIYCNGHFAAYHQGITPFACDVTDFLTDGRISLTVHVWDQQMDPRLPRGKQTHLDRIAGCFYEKITGIWGSVWLEMVPQYHLTEVTARADAATGTVVVDFEVNAHGDQSLVAEADHWDGDRRVSETQYAMVGAPSHIHAHMSPSVTLQVPPGTFEPWTPKNPRLYDVRIRLLDADAEDDDEGVLDEAVSYTGFTTVGVEGAQFLLNGEPFYTKSALYQGYWPNSLWTPPSDEAIVADIKLALEMGFNNLRLHQLLVSPRFLYWADRLGLTVWGELPNTQSFRGFAQQEMLAEWARAVRRDRGHPSILVWVPINESWGVGHLDDENQRHFVRAAYWRTKSIDPTRPVVDNDGWEHVGDVTDLCTIHQYIFADEWDQRGLSANPPVTGDELSKWGSRRVFCEGAYAGQPIMITEWGGWSFFLDDPNIQPDQFTCWGYGGVLYKTWEEIVGLYEGYIEELRKRPWIVGHCYTEFCDQFVECNGLLTFDRRPKGDLSVIKRINDRLG
jgi:beta-galactosidase/beta-glucuronidase